MIEKILTIIPSVLLAVASISMTITSIINYFSCDSCRAKRQTKLAQLMLKIKENEQNGKN